MFEILFLLPKSNMYVLFSVHSQEHWNWSKNGHNISILIYFWQIICKLQVPSEVLDLK